jgi:NAD(P)-dependent dehydrogenase (short-subunit alcohol dehydrogenase family)
MTTYLITGASRGIGAEMVTQLRHRGDTVIAATRQPTPHLAKLGAKVIDGIEVTSPLAVAHLAGQLSGRKIDVLINNAGISNSDDWEKEPLDIMRRLYEVNALAPVEVTRRLLPHLAPAAKIVMITSRLGSIAGTTADIADVGYRMSKAALNIAGKLMAESLKPKGITVLLIHPGYVRTEMNDGRGDIDARASARGVLALIERTGIEKTGTYWHVEGRELPW